MATKPKTRKPTAKSPTKAKAEPRQTKHQMVIDLVRRPEGGDE
jgi:hypothetical protein